jgi:hypothetical protein
MRKAVFLIITLLLNRNVCSWAGEHQAAPHFKYCGMDREKFRYRRMTIEYGDGGFVAACSIHSTSAYLALHIEKTPKTIWVADYDSNKLVDAEKATWVIAEEFLKSHKGDRFLPFKRTPLISSKCSVRGWALMISFTGHALT